VPMNAVGSELLITWPMRCAKTIRYVPISAL
jgi:hypothetical protein